MLLLMYDKHYETIEFSRNFFTIFNQFSGVFSKWSRTFIEFSEFWEFRESEKLLRHELGSA